MGAAKPCEESGGDALKLEFSRGKAAERVELLAGILPKLSHASTVRSLRSRGTPWAHCYAFIESVSRMLEVKPLITSGLRDNCSLHARSEVSFT